MQHSNEADEKTPESRHDARRRRWPFLVAAVAVASGLLVAFLSTRDTRRPDRAGAAVDEDTGELASLPAAPSTADAPSARSAEGEGGFERAAADTAVFATVGDEPITRAAYEQYRKLQIISGGTRDSSVVMDELIARTLLVLDARARGLEVERGELDEAVMDRMLRIGALSQARHPSLTEGNAIPETDDYPAWAASPLMREFGRTTPSVPGIPDAPQAPAIPDGLPPGATRIPEGALPSAPRPPELPAALAKPVFGAAGTRARDRAVPDHTGMIPGMPGHPGGHLAGDPWSFPDADRPAIAQLEEARAVAEQLRRGVADHDAVPEALLRPIEGAMRWLRKAKISTADLREEVEADLLADRIKKERIYRKIKVSKRELRTALARRHAALQSPQRRTHRPRLGDLTDEQRRDLARSVKVERGQQKLWQLLRELAKTWPVVRHLRDGHRSSGASREGWSMEANDRSDVAALAGGNWLRDE